MTADCRQDVMKVRCTSEVQRLAPMMDFAQVVRLAGCRPHNLFRRSREFIRTRKTYYIKSKHDINSQIFQSSKSQELLSSIGNYRTAIVSVI